MAKIKIISNPYEKKIAYQHWNDITEEWEPISYDSEDYMNSNLLKAEYTTKFFPFKVQEIVDIIIQEFCTGLDPIEILFEGTTDEFKDLQTICESDFYRNAVKASRTNRYLENARDILPDVKAMFADLKQLITQSVSDEGKIKDDLDKFVEASNDIIPICVMGNYSAGKSTFINALIGSEILPSADAPTTAKIYRISRTANENQAAVQFEAHGKEVSVRFDGSDYSLSGEDMEEPVVNRIVEILKTIAGERLEIKLNKLLALLNDYEDEDKEVEDISNVIDIEFPFQDGPLARSRNRFVIFDTPGSNSATYYKHSEVLKQAMEDLSNGLPIYVSERSALDSKDNESLCNTIREMKALDDRFTMIIVNKADRARLPKQKFSDEDIDKILNEHIPRSLYSEGIYFVSSIMGLGVKNGGTFLDDHYDEIFYDQKRKYEDPNERNYKSLYQYNIMPYQMKQKVIEESRQCQNLVFANSGLYCVEKDIEEFAGKYAPYNKCRQSELFLGNAIRLTEEDMERVKAEREVSIERRKEELEKNKQELLLQIDNEGEELRKKFEEEYYDGLSKTLEEAKQPLKKDTLVNDEESIQKQHREEFAYETRREELKERWRKAGGSLRDNLQSVVNDRRLDTIISMGKRFAEDVGDTIDGVGALRETRKDIDRACADTLLQKIIHDYTNQYETATQSIDETSMEYWKNCVEELKKKLAAIVSGSEALTAERREELTDIILTYQSIGFEKLAEEIFVKDKFMQGIRIGNLTITESLKLNLGKIARTYNQEMEEAVDRFYEATRDSHKKSFEAWLTELLNLIKDHIEEYNPELYAQVQIIQEEIGKIEDLMSRQKKLAQYKNSLKSMMDWKTQ